MAVLQPKERMSWTFCALIQLFIPFKLYLLIERNLVAKDPWKTVISFNLQQRNHLFIEELQLPGKVMVTHFVFSPAPLPLVTQICVS